MKQKLSYLGGIAAIAAVLCAVPTAAPAAGKGTLTASPSTIDCGSQVVGTGSKPCPAATLTNTSASQVRVIAINIRGDTTEIGAGANCKEALDPGESCTLITSFNPGDTGRARATVSVFDQDGLAVRVRVVGIGVAG
jgi:hypothetical protein